MSFTESSACRSQAHCRKCRNKEGGRAWRQEVIEAWGGPDDVDFACPLDKPWGFKSPRGLGDTIQSAIHTVTGGKVTPCGGCLKRQEALNRLLPYKESTNGSATQ